MKNVDVIFTFAIALKLYEYEERWWYDVLSKIFSPPDDPTVKTSVWNIHDAFCKISSLFFLSKSKKIYFPFMNNISLEGSLFQMEHWVYLYEYSF